MGHLKRLFMPKSWPIKRKGIKFVMRPRPGPHPISNSFPLGLLLRDLLKFAKTTRELRYILNKKIVLVDGLQRKDKNFPVGLFDVITFPDTDESYRVIFNKKGKIELIKDKINNIKLCKIIGKKKIKGKIQVNLNDGKNILVVEDKYKVGDSLLISIPKFEIKDHIKLEQGNLVCLIGGKHIGDLGKIEGVKEDKVIYKNEEGILIETLKQYAFPIGKDKPLIKIKH